MKNGQVSLPDIIIICGFNTKNKCNMDKNESYGFKKVLYLCFAILKPVGV